MRNLHSIMDNLCHRDQAGEGQPTEALHHIECNLQILSIVLYPSALLEPLDDVLQRTCSGDVTSTEKPYVLPKSRQPLQTH